MGDFDFSDVLAAAHKVPGALVDGKWRCVVYLSAFDWMHGWLHEPDVSAQSTVCKEWLAAHDDLKKAETVRNRNALRNIHVAFNELMGVIENRRADCVVVPDITVFASSFSEARFYVEEVLVPMGFRFIDCARKFDTCFDDVRGFFKALQAEMSEACALQREHNRLLNGKLIRRNVPYGYVFDPALENCVRVDDEVAEFVPKIFEFATEERWWRKKMEEQVRALGCPGVRQRSNALYGLNALSMEGWDVVNVRRMLRNPFYTGDYIPSAVASSRMRNSGISLDIYPVRKNHHEALVSWELFEAANAGIKRNYCACPSEAEGRKPYNV